MPRSGDTQGEKCRMGEKAVYLISETLKGENVACLLSDRSRALAQAYVLKRQDNILY